MTSPVNVTVIDKEMVSGLKFPREEVLSSEKEVKERYAELERALTLGNLEHNKISLVFEDNEGLKQVNTTIWSLTDKLVILKKGMVIPINRIHFVKL